MTDSVTDQIPIVDVVAAAHTWTVDEIIKRQPGSYPTDMDGDRWIVWHSMFGTVRHARQVETGPELTRIRQEIRTTLPSGAVKIYTVSVLVHEQIIEGNDHEPSGADEHGAADGQLPPADRAIESYAEADSEDQAQAAEGGVPDSDRAA